MKRAATRPIDEGLARAVFDRALASYNQDFETFFLARLFDLDITYPDETCVIRIPVRDFMFNPQGSLHGGVIAFALDVSMGHLLKRTLGAGITLEMKTQFLRAATLGEVRCEARFLKKGSSINYLEARMSDSSGRAVAVATSTWMLLPRSGANGSQEVERKETLAVE